VPCADCANIHSAYTPCTPWTPRTYVLRQAYLYDGYWEDIGTIKSFYESNLALTDTNPNFRWAAACDRCT
jgi:ADP-glucose pyrophosphorylase